MLLDHGTPLNTEYSGCRVLLVYHTFCFMVTLCCQAQGFAGKIPEERKMCKGWAISLRDLCLMLCDSLQKCSFQCGETEHNVIYTGWSEWAVSSWAWPGGSCESGKKVHPVIQGQAVFTHKHISSLVASGPLPQPPRFTRAEPLAPAVSIYVSFLTELPSFTPTNPTVYPLSLSWVLTCGG